MTPANIRDFRSYSLFDKPLEFLGGAFRAVAIVVDALFRFVSRNTFTSKAGPVPRLRLLEFYCRQGVILKPGSGIQQASFEEVIGWDNRTLEDAHHYIQFLFPTETASKYNSDAPILNRLTIQCLQTNAKAQKRIIQAFNRMMAFYGLRVTLEQNEVTIERAPFWAERSKGWLTRGNHNFLRISRILHSMNLLGYKKYSLALLKRLRDIAGSEGLGICKDSLLIWEQQIS